MSTLILHIHRAWFDAIAQGYKTYEYRDASPYWTKRLQGRQYESVLLHNGYRPSDPMLTLDFGGCTRVEVQGRHLYRIALGQIQESRNYQLLPRLALPPAAESVDLNQPGDPKHYAQYMVRCEHSGYWLPKRKAAHATAPARMHGGGGETPALGREIGRIVI